jgi:hypothetical protein
MERADIVPLALFDLPRPFLERLVQMLSKMHRVSLYIAVMWDRDYTDLKECYESGWFEPDMEEEEQELQNEIDGSLAKLPYWCEQIGGKVRIADFVCDSLVRTARTYRDGAQVKKCSRREQSDGDKSCNALTMHALHMEAVITPTPGKAFPCYSCLRQVDVSHVFLSRYIVRSVPYCVQCLVKSRSMLLISERALETDHGIPRAILRSEFRFHQFDLSIAIDAEMPYTNIQLNCETGPIVVFKRPVQGNGPDHYYYYIGDVDRIKQASGAESNGIVSDDTRIKRVRKQPEVKQKIAELATILKAEGFKISRLSIGPLNPAKRRKIKPAPSPSLEPDALPIIAPMPNLLELPPNHLLPNVTPQADPDDWPANYLP